MNMERALNRIIDPPIEFLDSLPTPLTPGERELLDLFNDKLPEHWEIYIQPHLNGTRPDLVLLSPIGGIAIFEVKDWNLDAMTYEVIQNPATGKSILACRGPDGRQFSYERKNPVRQVSHYESELLNLYCPRLDGRSGLGVITAGLVFTRSSHAQVDPVFKPLQQNYGGMSKYGHLYPIVCQEDLQSGDMNRIFPHWDRNNSRDIGRAMTAETAADLRGWLKEPFFSQEQRLPLELDKQQRDLIATRTESGYRRIKGPAGSGKSLVLAARAAELADAGHEVLVVSFNITLLSYLRDLAARHVTKRRTLRRQVEFLHFHGWCKRICLHADAEEAYDQIWRKPSSLDGSAARLADLVAQLYLDPSLADHMPLYDAIIVDEGQDFRPEWWGTLRRALRPGGEMILAADPTQDVYRSAAAWTDVAMKNAGFSGPWAKLSESYRLPPVMLPLLCEFIQAHMSGDCDPPHSEQQLELSDLFPTALRWVQVKPDSDPIDSCLSEVKTQMKALQDDTAIPDITILAGEKPGLQLVDKLESSGVKVRHTFGGSSKEQRRRKLAFRKGDAHVKATTLHSFKGWEARHLVVFVGSSNRQDDRAALYTAMTRVRRHEHGSMITVVSTCPNLEQYGRMWPDFALV